MRVYSREFRLHVVRRILNGEKVPAVAQDLGIHRKLIYEWVRRVSEGGEDNLRTRGRPPKNRGGADETSTQLRIANLQKRIAHQQVIIEFLDVCLLAILPRTPGEKRAWQREIFRTIASMPESNGLSVEVMCGLAHVPRSGYYRFISQRGSVEG